MTTRDDKYTERLAYHEAGHAVVAKWLGLNIIKCTIVKNESTCAEGETSCIHPDASVLTYLLGKLGISTYETNDEDKIAYLMAGIEAVKLAGCEKSFSIEGSELSDDIIEASSDIVEAKGIAVRSYPESELLQGMVFESGRVKTEVLLTGYIDLLRAITLELIERKTLSGAEIDEIIACLHPSGMRNKG